MGEMKSILQRSPVSTLHTIHTRLKMTTQDDRRFQKTDLVETTSPSYSLFRISVFPASSNEVTEKLGLYNHKEREWFIETTCAVPGEGTVDGKESFADNLKKKSKHTENYY